MRHKKKSSKPSLPSYDISINPAEFGEHYMVTIMSDRAAKFLGVGWEVQRLDGNVEDFIADMPTSWTIGIVYQDGPMGTVVADKYTLH